MYSGGSHSNGSEYECVRLQGGQKSNVTPLFCTYEEADDRIIFHINHAILSEECRTVHVCSGDTDIHVRRIYNYER